MAPASVFTVDAEAAIHDPDVDVVVELLGGIEPARRLVRSSLISGKHVVSGNKDLLASSPDLFTLAASSGVDLRFEAAVGAALPVVAGLGRYLATVDISSFEGVLNGTSNFILSQMAEGGSLSAALETAQRLGFAEQDPGADIDGHDAAAKAALLASMAFDSWVYPDSVEVRGISKVSPLEIYAAKLIGRNLQLLATGVPGRIEVAPTLLPSDHPLASVRGGRNGLLVDTGIGRLEWFGPGAGGPQTALAVAADVVALREGSYTIPPSRLTAAARVQSPPPHSATPAVKDVYLFCVTADPTWSLNGSDFSDTSIESDSLFPDVPGLWLLRTSPVSRPAVEHTLHRLASVPGVERVGPPLRLHGPSTRG